jgi:hypothetical protein
VRRSLSLLVLAVVLVALALGARSVRAAGSASSVEASPFPGGLSPQWLNAADVEPTACLAKLAASGAKYTVLPAQQKPNAKGCGVPHGVLVTRGPTGITYSPPLWVDCSFATLLEPIETIIQEEARSELDTSIRHVDTFGAYVCVTRAGPWTTRFATKPAISEHSFGLAFDLRSLTPAKGRPITVLQDYEQGVDEPVTPRGRFLRNVAIRLKRESGLTHVLTPDFDAAHRNHFHLDRGLPFGWWWATGNQ